MFQSLKRTFMAMGIEIAFLVATFLNVRIKVCFCKVVENFANLNIADVGQSQSKSHSSFVLNWSNQHMSSLSMRRELCCLFLPLRLISAFRFYDNRSAAQELFRNELLLFCANFQLHLQRRRFRLGISCSCLLRIYIRDEIRYVRHWHL